MSSFSIKKRNSPNLGLGGPRNRQRERVSRAVVQPAVSRKKWKKKIVRGKMRKEIISFLLRLSPVIDLSSAEYELVVT
jgi:hypothetical protein